MLVVENHQIFWYLGVAETKDLSQLRCPDSAEMTFLSSNGPGAYHENFIPLQRRKPDLGLLLLWYFPLEPNTHQLQKNIPHGRWCQMQCLFYTPIITGPTPTSQNINCLLWVQGRDPPSSAICHFPVALTVTPLSHAPWPSKYIGLCSGTRMLRDVGTEHCFMFLYLYGLLHLPQACFSYRSLDRRQR